MKSGTSKMSSFCKSTVLTLVLAMSGVVAFAQSKTAHPDFSVAAPTKTRMTA